MKELTKAEEQVMQLIWDLGPSFVRDVLERMPDPKPAYTTVATVIKALEKKGFLSHEEFGKNHRFSPLILRDEYAKMCVNTFVNSYFENSFSKLVSFFTKEKKINMSELEEIIKMMSEEEKKEK